MPALRTLPPLFVTLALLLPVAVQADDLKDISQLAQQGQAPQALTRLNDYIAKNPKSVDALFLRGVILTDTGKRDEAMKAFADMTEKYPGLPEPYNNLAVLYAERGEYDKARKALESAIKTHPSYATAHENLGDIYARMASQAYDKALQLDNGNTRPQSKLALIKSLTPSTPPTLVAGQSSTATSVSMPPAPIIIGNNGQTRVLEQTRPVVKYEAAKPESAPKPSSVVTETKPQDTKPADAKPPVDSKPPAQAEAAVKTPPPKAADTGKPAVDARKPQEQTKAADNIDEQAIEQAVRQWAKAWSDKNVSAYLASYGAGFKTPDGQSRQDWEKTRKQRISAPASISVEVSNLRLKQDGDQVRASFKQSYRAGGTAMRTNKTLVLKKGGNRWLIEQELTDR